MSSNAAISPQPFGDLTQRAVFQAGDGITVSLLDAAGNIIGEPTTYTVTSKMIETAFISLALEVMPNSRHNRATPRIIRIRSIQETWIPYQLSGSASVTIYDL